MEQETKKLFIVHAVTTQAIFCIYSQNPNDSVNSVSWVNNIHVDETVQKDSVFALLVLYTSTVLLKYSCDILRGRLV